MSSFIRRKVSQNRIRFENDGYDLDLTYICDNIIAMGLPAETFIQCVARNPLDLVARYLKEKHDNCYKIYNLLRRAKYNYSQFDNMVESFPMYDHNPPVFTLIDEFCRSVHEWLLKKNENVAVVHCKAGKGRTGTMISCYFIYSAKFQNPFDAMEYFSSKRCSDGKGVTIPSQRRYVEYYADYLNKKRIYSEIDLFLKQIDITLPNNSFFNTISFKLFKENSIKLFDSEDKKLSLKDETVNWQLKSPIRINGDIKIEFSNKVFHNKNSIFSVTFNTFFLSQNIEKFCDKNHLNDEKSCLGETIFDDNNTIIWKLNKQQIDNACKDKRFSYDMKLVFHFDRNPQNDNGRNSIITNGKDLNYIAFDNLQVTDDDGFYTQKNVDSLKKSSSSTLFNQNDKKLINKSDSYVTKLPFFELLQTDDITFNDNHTETNNSEKSILDRFNIKSKEESKKVLLIEPSNTSSELSHSDDTESSNKSYNMNYNKNKNFNEKSNRTNKITVKLFENPEPINEKGECVYKAPKDKNNKVFSFFNKKKFFSIKKSHKLKISKKYQRQHNTSINNSINIKNKNDSINHDESIDYKSKSFDLFSNTSNTNKNKIKIENNKKDKSEEEEEEDDDDDYDEVYDDGEDEDVEEDRFKNDKKNFKTFFSKIK